MTQILYGVDIRVEHDSYDTTVRSISAGIYSDEPNLIHVCSQDGGSSLSVAEARQLIDALQKAIEMIEGK